jgi:hypothetical protein
MIVLDEIVFWHWLALAGVLVVIEIAAPGVVFLWLGIAAGVTGLALLAVPGMGYQIQLTLFAVLSVAAVIAGRRLVRRTQSGGPASTLNRRGAQYVGSSFALEDDTENGHGKVRIADSHWSVKLEGSGDLPKGTRVVVTGCDGATLRVRAADQESSSASAP